MQPFIQRPVWGYADGFVFGSVINELGVLVPVGLAQAKPVHCAARSTVAFQVGESSLRITVLKGVESALLAPLEQFHDPLRRMPRSHVMVEVLVEVRVAVDGIAPDDQPCDSMRTQ